MAANTRSALVPVAVLMFGMVFSVPILLVSFGGGFILALVVIAIAPFVVGATAIRYSFAMMASPFGQRAAAAMTLHGRIHVRRTALVSASIIVIFAVVMTVLHDVRHTFADFEAYWLYLLSVAVGGGLLAGLAAEPLRRGEIVVAAIAGIGLFASFSALMSCCLWTIGANVPVVASVVLQIIINMIPITLGGILLGMVGILTLMMVEGRRPTAVALRR